MHFNLRQNKLKDKITVLRKNIDLTIFSEDCLQSLV